MDYPYNKLQDLFHCSSKTIALAKVHCILFDCDGTPPAKLKFTLGNMSVLMCWWNCLNFSTESISRPSSCRSVITDGQETPVRYWKDNVKEIFNQYPLEFPSGVKPTFIYTHLPPNFCYNTMLAGFCNLCDVFRHSNFEKFMTFLGSVERATMVSVKHFMKTHFAHQVQRNSPCLELCMTNVFASCLHPHNRFCSDACDKCRCCCQVCQV